jgi:CheY-like chemotaxis protein
MRPDSAAKKKVLVIDDNRLILKTTCALLRQMGYETLEALGGSAGMEMARAMGPDLVLLDLSMPEVDGWETFKRLKKDPGTSGIPVVIFTSREYANLEAAGLEGACGLIRKPFVPEELEEIVEKIGFASPRLPSTPRRS